MTLDEAAKATQQLIEAVRAVKPDVIALAHGGQMENPEDVAYVLERTSARGFVGASLVAPSDRFNFLAILAVRVFLRAIVFSSRTCTDVQARLFFPFF